MQTIAQIYLPLLRKLDWPKTESWKPSSSGLFQAFGDAAELYRSAAASAYLTALCLGQRNEPPPHDEDLEGRDPRW